MVAPLPDVTLKFSEALWKAPWSELIAERTGESAKLLTLLREMGLMAKECSAWSATPAAVAWQLLWSRNFRNTEAALALVECDLVYTGGGRLQTLELILRQALELNLDLMVIANPNQSSLGEVSPNAESGVLERHCAFLAYSAVNECRYLSEIMMDYVQRAITHEPPIDDPDLCTLVDALWGDGVEAARKGFRPRLSKGERKKHAFSLRNRLLRWLQHEALAPWYEEIRERGVKSFSALVSDRGDNTRQRLKKFDMGFGYPMYQRASAVVHGSHVTPFLELLGDELHPALIALDDDIEREAAHVRRFSHNNTLRLLQLQRVISKHS